MRLRYICSTRKEGKMSKNRSIFGERVLSLRRRKHLTQEALADISNLSQAEVSRIETGHFQQLSRDTIGKLAHAFEITAETLFPHARPPCCPRLSQQLPRPSGTPSPPRVQDNRSRFTGHLESPLFIFFNHQSLQQAFAFKFPAHTVDILSRDRLQNNLLRSLIYFYFNASAFLDSKLSSD